MDAATLEADKVLERGEEPRAQPVATSSARMYDDFSGDYDRFVNWEGRLGAELPFLESQLEAVDARRVLDAACGTGMHAIALAKRGYQVVGADLSAGMIDLARANATQAGVDVPFQVAGFGELRKALDSAGPGAGGQGSSPFLSGQDRLAFDALLCLGNSLPHVLTPEDLLHVLRDFAAVLRPGGLLLIQNRNFDAVLAEGHRWMGPEGHAEGESEWLFLRFYDFLSDGLIRFNIVRLHRKGRGAWNQRVTSTQLWPQTRRELSGAIRAAGFEALNWYGDLQGTSFDEESSPNLVMTARRSTDE